MARIGHFALPAILILLMGTSTSVAFPADGGRRQRGRNYLPPSTVRRSEKAIRANALNLVQPEYQDEEGVRRANGRVKVEITIDEFGKVIQATAFAGHWRLRALATMAARQSTFRPTLDSGVPKKVLGILTYYFPKPTRPENLRLTFAIQRRRLDVLMHNRKLYNAIAEERST